jgi:ubiquitin-protein ligase
MELSSKNIKRITRDITILQKCPLVEEKIYVVPDENDITLARVCMFGPSNTPYENGIYFFEVKFPNNYPYSPPKVKYLTTDGNTRMHPNFYCCGKVCLSIIGTWNGPGWTSCQSLSSVLVTIRSLFIENPLWQEPGFNGELSERNSDYNKLIKYENIRIAMLKMANKPPRGYEVFNNIITEHLIKNKVNIINFCNSQSDLNNKEYYSPSIYNFSKLIRYDNLLKDFDKYYSSINMKLYEKFDTQINNILKSIKEPIISFKDFSKLYIDNSDSLNTTMNNFIAILHLKDKIKLENEPGFIKLI